MPIYHVPTHRQQTKVRLNNDRAWQRAAAAWLQQYPLCALCLARGQINARSIADECSTQRTLVVDHIEPHRGNVNLFWDQNNWQTLCRLCHDIEKQRHEQRGGTAAQWIDMLRDEARRTGSQLGGGDDIARWLPPGVGGSER